MSHKSDVYFPTDLDLFDVFVKTDSFILSKLEGNHFYEIKGVKDNVRLYTLVDSVYAQYKIDFYIDEKKQTQTCLMLNSKKNMQSIPLYIQ